ncbi:MAG: Abi family protein, partial [Ureaplasma sp.]|nr:Abi family protein [Ureaplasma sp.]
IEPNDKLFLKYNKNNELNYNKIPIWILSQCWSFGDLINLFKLLNRDLQYKIINSYKNFRINSDQFIHIMKVIKKIRNIAVHRSVLYNIEINFKTNIWEPILNNKVFNVEIENNFFNLFNLAKIVDRFTNNESRDIIYDLKLILNNNILNSKSISKNSKSYILDKIGIKTL